MPDSPVTAAESADVVIVGARCAGAATAVTLARAGHHVIVLDAATLPSDTLSTHLLWPAGLAELHRLGARTAVEALGAPRLSHAYAAGAGYGITSTFPAVDGIDYALCVRRTGLDDVLVRTAITAGADVRQRCRVTDLLWSGNRCAGVRYTDSTGTVTEISTGLVVGADGRHSTVATLAGAAQPYHTVPSGRDCYYAYWRDTTGLPRDTAAQWRAGADLGTAFPCDDGLILSLVQPPTASGRTGPTAAERRYTAAIARIPELAARLDGCHRIGRVRAATGLASYFRRSTGPGWALPGDAGHFKDPVTAQGIRDALRYGRLLGEAAADHLTDADALDRALRAWERRRVVECRAIFHWTNRLARGEAMRPMEIELYRRAAADPALAQLATGIFTRTNAPGELYAPRRAAQLAFGALRHHPDTPAALRDIASEIRTGTRDAITTHTVLRGAPPTHPAAPAPDRPAPRSELRATLTVSPNPDRRAPAADDR
ncbi:NAD(P)/FAD-dependent oxidoreductase [Nocardia rhizosphaerae]|uniref:NAD(P)/FAD-dependent oxidoreductase n=1 Tax=Nocardia rhizosphaerae TaxID=1691571 RepID=A0ABV8LBW6_9NOCA